MDGNVKCLPAVAGRTDKCKKNVECLPAVAGKRAALLRDWAKGFKLQNLITCKPENLTT